MRSTGRWPIYILVFVVASITLINVRLSLYQVDSQNGTEYAIEQDLLRIVLSRSAASPLSGKLEERDIVHKQITEQYPPIIPGQGSVYQPRETEKWSSALFQERTSRNATELIPQQSVVKLSKSKSTLALAGNPYKSQLPKVQAQSDQGDIKPPRVSPPTDRQLFQSVDDLLPIRPQLKILTENFDNSTINPILPSAKVRSNVLTGWNLEIPLDYSIEASMTSTVPWSNCTTLAFYEGRLRSGFRNQIMAFVILILEANNKFSKLEALQPHGQVLLRSLGQKDTYGTNSFIPFAKLWDVAHWNSHYPRLPRLVDYDPILHSQFNFDNTRWYRTPLFDNNTMAEDSFSPAANWFGTYGLFATPKPKRPYAYGYQHKLMAAYTFYAKGKGPYASNLKSNTGNHRNPAEILMLQGAMRPHPDLQTIIDRLLIQASLLPPNQSTAAFESTTRPLQLEYMTLHARVEPDMQKHRVCRDKKVINLTDIFDFMERKWSEPPVSKIFMPINRQYLEREGDIYNHGDKGTRNRPKVDKKKFLQEKRKINWIAVENLQALNRARDQGLWGGRAKVFEFGAQALNGTSYADKPSTAGAMLNFFISVPAKIFIGTEVSSFSHDLLATRFFRGYSQNYKYLPDGLHEWTPLGTIDPPGFAC